MVKALNHDDDALVAECDPGKKPEAPLSDDALLDLLDALVEERGRVPAAQALGVNYRTLALCCDSREVSRRMRRALVEFRDRGGAGGGETEDGNGEGPLDGDRAVLRQRVAELEDENAELRDLADDQARQLELLTRRLAALEYSRQSGDAPEVVGVDTDADADDALGHDLTDGVDQDWRPPRRRPGMPDAGVVTLEVQPDEEHAFGPAAALVATITIYAVVTGFGDAELPADTRTTTAEVADSIFSTYIVPFEAVSVLLLAALIGAIVIARRN